MDKLRCLAKDGRVQWLVWIALLLAATALRLPGADWDAVPSIPGTAIAAHPDERYLLGVAQSTPLWGDPCATSPDFPYGHLPVYMARLLVMAAPNNDPLYAARLLSGLTGVLLVAVAGAWGKALAGARGACFAALVMAFAPFPIQQAHFYTVDPLGTVLASMAILYAMRRRWTTAGAFAGLAVACKVSLVWCGAVVVAGYWLQVAGCGLRAGRSANRKLQITNWTSYFSHYVLRVTFCVLFPMFLAFVVSSPWSLLCPATCWRGPLMQASMATGRFDFPYTRQYAGTWPFVYPLAQMALWGLGPLATLAGLAGVVFALVRWQQWSFAVRMSCVWTVIYFLATAGLYAKFPRYLLPLYPVWAACGVWAIGRLRGRICGVLYVLVCLSTAALGLAQVSIYAQPHPWIVASEWIYANVVPGEMVAVEAWEHPLPVPLSDYDAGRYAQVTLPIFDEDAPEKSATLSEATRRANVIALASRRGYGALTRDLSRNAGTLDRYRSLLAENEVISFGRCPRLGPLALTDDPLSDAGLPVPMSLAKRCGTRFALRLPRLDESFCVYDAPMVLLVLKPTGGH